MVTVMDTQRRAVAICCRSYRHAFSEKGKNMAWIKRHRNNILLGLILMLTAVLLFNRIGKIGDGNAYYTATVSSMLTSWHNFFYASFDPGGFITVDKPALGFWLQCLFGLIFGVHGWSLALPGILCSIASVFVLYKLVARYFGEPTGLLAALMLALTPIFVAATRTNNLDASLVLVCLLAVWAAVIAAEKGSLKHLILAAALIGVGFNIKMLQAFLYLPAIYLVYFFTAKTKWTTRLWHLAVATGVLLILSLSWCVIVDLTPADSRPYIGSSQTNSAIELALGYNGLSRLLGAVRGGAGSGMVSSLTTMNGGAPNEGGDVGVLRLFNADMAAQASWLLVSALLGLLALLYRTLTEKDKDARRGVLRQLLLWGGLLAPMVVFFSVAQFFHRYYLIMLAPVIAALAAIAVREAMRLFARDGETGRNRWMNLALPILFAVSAGVEIYILSAYYPDQARVLVPIIATISALAIGGLIAVKRLKREDKPIFKAVVAVGLLAILVTPGVWSVMTSFEARNNVVPTAWLSQTANRPYAQDGGVRPDNNADRPYQMPNSDGNHQNDGAPPVQLNIRLGSSLPDNLVRYLVEHDIGARWLVAVPNANIAGPVMLEYDVSIMALGGFAGNDDVLDLEGFMSLVESGQLQYYWIAITDKSEIARWVEQNGAVIEPTVWGGEVYKTGTLYDLTGLFQ